MNKTKLKLEPGDKVRILLKKGDTISGILMPSKTRGFLLIKLESGYNIGISKKEIVKINKIGRKKLEKFPEATIKQDKNKPLISVIVAGGTISSRIDYSTGAVSSLMKPDNLFFLAPDVAEIASVEIENPFSILSENMTSKHWKALAKISGKYLNKKNVSGVIITHGTDTLHYTSAALSFMLNNLNKPVVITYAQRSSDRPSTDAILNLKTSAIAALSEIAEVVVVGHGTINDYYSYVLRGTKVRKMHSTRRDTFRPINTLPIARIWDNGKIEYISDFNRRNKGNVNVDAVFNDKVALVKFYPNSDPEILDFFYSSGYKGIVIEATGMGHVSNIGNKNWKRKIKEVIGDMVICFAPQTLYGSLNPYVYSTARELNELGVLYLKDILPETAYVKLGYVLGKTRNKEKVKKLMLTNLANEFSKKETPETFLY